MSHQFDNLTKAVAQSVTRRGALKKFGVGLAAMALACIGLPTKARAKGKPGYCLVTTDPGGGAFYLSGWCGDCKGGSVLSPDCTFGAPASVTKVCGWVMLSSVHCR
jgi:hypothetical protein